MAKTKCSVVKARICCKKGGIGVKIGISAGVGIGAGVSISVGVGIGAEVNIGAEIGIGVGAGIGASSEKNAFRPFGCPFQLHLLYTIKN